MVKYEFIILIKLGIRDNKLKELPNEIEKLKSLKELHIQSNHLQALPPCMGTIFKYKIFKCFNTKIIFLCEANLDLFSDKSIIRLENNPWIPQIQEAVSINIYRLQTILSSDEYKK